MAITVKEVKYTEFLCCRMIWSPHPLSRAKWLPTPYLSFYSLSVCSLYSSPTVHSLAGEGAGGHKSYNTNSGTLYPIQNSLYGNYIKARKFSFTVKIHFQYFSMRENFSEGTMCKNTFYLLSDWRKD